uniref:Myb-like domain-containing protein n=1 Tax=Brassica oleracea var. oleracea TaxID=109376 RepID=A0A0D3BZI7_BRAOL
MGRDRRVYHLDIILSSLFSFLSSLSLDGSTPLGSAELCRTKRRSLHLSLRVSLRLSLRLSLRRFHPDPDLRRSLTPHRSVLPHSTDLSADWKLKPEIPPFSSQQTEAPTQPEVTPVERRERKKWTPADDEVLISAWLNTSKDAVVANDQNARTFWKRVGEYYAASRHATEGEKREHLHCKQRWHKINELTNKFCAAYAILKSF